MKSKLFKHMSLPEMYTLDVDKENKIYFEVSGKKDGIPVFFVHGGPGGHCRSCLLYTSPSPRDRG